MSVKVRIGPAITVNPKRDRKAAEDPVMMAIEQQLHQLLDLPGKPESNEKNSRDT